LATFHFSSTFVRGHCMVVKFLGTIISPLCSHSAISTPWSTSAVERIQSLLDVPAILSTWARIMSPGLKHCSMSTLSMSYDLTFCFQMEPCKGNLRGSVGVPWMSTWTKNGSTLFTVQTTSEPTEISGPLFTLG
jgi:hypothetical protein